MLQFFFTFLSLFKRTLLLCFSQLIKESGIDLSSKPPVRLGDKEDVNYEAVTTTVKKAIRLNRAIQAWDGHWPAENAGPLFFTPPLVIIFLFRSCSLYNKRYMTK